MEAPPYLLGLPAFRAQSFYGVVVRRAALVSSYYKSDQKSGRSRSANMGRYGVDIEAEAAAVAVSTL